MPYNSLDPAGAAAAPVITVGNPLAAVGETLLSLKTELLLRLGSRSDIGAGRPEMWINFAYFDIVTSLEIDDMKGSYSFNTVAGTYLYKLPDAVFYTDAVSSTDETTYPDAGGLQYELIDLDRYRRLPATTVGTQINTAQPLSYFRYAKMLVLYPTPSLVSPVAVDFLIRPGKLVADGDSPILAYEWHEAILLLARAKAHSALLEYDLAEIAHNEYINFVRRKLDKGAQEQKGTNAQVTPVRSRRQLNRSRGIATPRNTDKSI